MKKSKVLSAYLTLSGLLLTVIGGSTLLMPVVVKASSGIDLAGNVNLLNDVRGGGALLLALALTTLVGAFSNLMRFTSTLLSVILFLSIGIGRIFSIVADGMPVESLIKATVVEFVVGSIGIALFLIHKEK
jgi:hypothetical protein